MTRRAADYYFAYGSNLHKLQMGKRCPGSNPVSPFELAGWRLVFRRVADIIPATESSVHGALYTITPADELALDRYEGYRADLPDLGTYRKVYVETAVDGEPAAIMFYVINSTTFAPPPLSYLEIIRQGYADWQIDTSSLETIL